MIVPDYYERFRCIGGECRHNCCRGGWDIEVDDEALERFKRIEGEFGERVRAAVNDEKVFIRKNGQCPLLNSNGLCEMVLHGEELCIICDEFPRFTEFYEDYSERGVSLACEAANVLILDNTNKVCLQGEVIGCDEPIFVFVNKTRNAVFEILQNREYDIFKRLRLALDYSYAAQVMINDNDYGELDYTPKDTAEGHESLAPFVGLLLSLEILEDDWRGLLSKLLTREKSVPGHIADDIKGEQLAVYFVYRYFLKGAFDCDVLSKMKLVALSVMTIIALENTIGDICECARRYSIEVEHDEDNIEAIYDELLFGEQLLYDDILRMTG
ncbi:MAG: flagellin lysine-N-methylase [Clostridia bacterium]|nr:flagellin lysine-N-methylase [Clostridia bacterium]